MLVSTSQALGAMQRSVLPSAAKPHLLIAGATGALGNAVMHRLVGAHRFEHTLLLAREPMAQGMRMVSLQQVKGDVRHWPVIAQRCDAAVVMFEPPRMFYERERALWTPEPEQLPHLAAWLKSCGVSTLTMVLPHVQGSLPESLKRGLASLDEQALASLGFERLIIVRSAQKPTAQVKRHPLEKLAQWMLGIFQFMVPAGEQPVRPIKIALIVDALLQMTPLGTTVLAQEEVWAWAQLKDDALWKSVQSRFDIGKEIN